MAISEDIKRLAREAMSDIGQTYQNALWQHAGFAVPSQQGNAFDPRTADHLDRTAETIEISPHSSADRGTIERE